MGLCSRPGEDPNTWKQFGPEELARWSEHQHVAPSPYARGREEGGAARDQRSGGGTRVFAVGQRVLAKFENSAEFFDGVIDSINRNGTFVVAVPIATGQ